MSAVITAVAKDSPAHLAGLKAGQILLSINGEEIRDVLDYRFFSYDAKLIIELTEPDGERRIVLVKKRDGEDLGLTFENYLMDRPRACVNKCIFCFVDQLPKGLRKTLYFKDDDARLSFMMGNYISLTNLTEKDIGRIISQRISPLGISVHATDPSLRAFMLGNLGGEQGYGLMKRFAEAGIEMKCQVVVCPGINDGKNLEKTLDDLCALFPRVSSVSVVPVGLTKHRQGLYPLKPVDRQAALDIVAIADGRGQECLNRCGSRVVYCADELYLKAGLEIPDSEYYEDYPQYENGVGMMRLFEEEFLQALKTTKPPQGKTTLSIATGMAAEDFLKRLIEQAQKKYKGIDCKVYGIKNLFLGESVDVAGLVSGGDIIKQLDGKKLGDKLLIPETMLRHGGDMFLDNVTPKEIEERLQVSLSILPVDGESMLKELWNIAQENGT